MTTINNTFYAKMRAAYNLTDNEGSTRCSCGCKYWDDITNHPLIPDGIRCHDCGNDLYYALMEKCNICDKPYCDHEDMDHDFWGKHEAARCAAAEAAASSTPDRLYEVRTAVDDAKHEVFQIRSADTGSDKELHKAQGLLAEARDLIDQHIRKVTTNG